MSTEPVNGHAPPWSPDAERSILGAMLRDNAVIPTVMSRLRENHFHSDAHQKIFKAIVSLYDRGHPADLVMLAELLKEQKYIEDVGGYPYLGELWDAAPTTANVEYYAQIVRDHATRRALIHLGQEMQRDAQRPTGPVEELVDRVKRALLAADQCAAGPVVRMQLPEPYQPFPVDALPEPARSFVAQGAAALGCDPAYLALPALTVLASAIGYTRTIRLKRGWDEPCVVWSAVVGDSGTMKSPAWMKAVEPLVAIQRGHLRDYKDQVRERKRSKMVPDDGDRPRLRRVVCSDTTVERLAGILEDNPRGILVARDELNGWLGSFVRYKGQRGGSDLPNWLEMFNARTITVDRVSYTEARDAVPIHVHGAAVSVCGGIQPGVLARALSPDAFDAGLAARVLMAWPTKRPKQWSEMEVVPEVQGAYAATVGRLLALDFHRDSEGEDVPFAVRLTPAAKEAWVQFFNSWGREQAAAEGALAAAFAKLEAYAARFTLIHHVVSRVARHEDDSDPIEPASVEAGVCLARWFAYEVRRIYAVLAESDADSATRKLVEHIQAQGGRITARELQRSNSRQYPNAAVAEAALNRLVEDGLAAWEQRPVGSAGGRPSRALRLCPTHDNTDTTANGKAYGHVNGDGHPADTSADNTPATPSFSAEIQGSVGIVMRRTDGVGSEASPEAEPDQAGGTVGGSEVVSDGDHGDAYEGP
jgi:hypothetical protein